MAKTLDYEPRGDGLWHPKARDEFEDDAYSAQPSFVRPDDRMPAPTRPFGIIRFLRIIWRAFGYGLVFIFYGLIFIVASFAAGIASGQSPDTLPAAFWFVAPPLFGCMGVAIQMRINRRRAASARARR